MSKIFRDKVESYSVNQTIQEANLFNIEEKMNHDPSGTVLLFNF